jgi:hypothetical protein
MPLNLAFFNCAISQVLLTAPSDGFIDFTSPRGYIVDNGADLETGWPTNIDFSLAKSRAYLRWQTVIQQLETNISPVETTAFSAPGADQNTPPTSVSFSVAYDRPDFLYTADELNPGTTLYGTAAITRFIARALISTITRNVLILDPTLVSGPQAHYGESTQEITVGPLFTTIAAAEAVITVIQVLGT